MDYAAIWDEAEAAGQAAVKAWLEVNGQDRGACGFAWVVIPVARGPFVTWCKKGNALATEQKTQEMGRAWPMHPYGDNHYPKGWCLWSPGSRNWNGQSVDCKANAAAAFAAVLNKHGIDCHHSSRLD